MDNLLFLTLHLIILTICVGYFYICVSSVQLLSCVQLFVTPWIAARQASLSITNSWSLLKFISIQSVMPSNHLILCCPLLFLPLNLSQHQCLFEGISSSYQVAKVLELQLQYQSLQYSGLISFRIDSFDLAVQGTSLLQQHSSKTSVLRHSAFFISNSHIHTWLLEIPQLWLDRRLSAK